MQLAACVHSVRASMSSQAGNRAMKVDSNYETVTRVVGGKMTLSFLISVALKRPLPLAH